MSEGCKKRQRGRGRMKGNKKDIYVNNDRNIKAGYDNK